MQPMISAAQVFASTEIMPVMVIERLEDAHSMAERALAAGCRALEITLRSEVALQALQQLRQAYPQLLVGAGTVNSVAQLQEVVAAGAQFALSPGSTPALLAAAQSCGIAYIPGVATVSEMLQAREAGFRQLKLFPAMAVGGIALLRSVYGPLPDLQFCPTGGLNAHNYQDFLALPNVACVGGSWVIESR